MKSYRFFFGSKDSDPSLEVEALTCERLLYLYSFELDFEDLSDFGGALACRIRSWSSLFERYKKLRIWKKTYFRYLGEFSEKLFLGICWIFSWKSLSWRYSEFESSSVAEGLLDGDIVKQCRINECADGWERRGRHFCSIGTESKKSKFWLARGQKIESQYKHEFYLNKRKLLIKIQFQSNNLLLKFFKSSSRLLTVNFRFGCSSGIKFRLLTEWLLKVFGHRTTNRND